MLTILKDFDLFRWFLFLVGVWTLVTSIKMIFFEFYYLYMHGKVFLAETCVETPLYDEFGRKIFYVHLRSERGERTLKFETLQEFSPGKYYKAAKQGRTLVYNQINYKWGAD